MLRRDFLKTIAAFAAASAAGGSVAAAGARPIVGSPLTADGIRVPAGPKVFAAAPLDLTLVRGEDVALFVSGLRFSPGLHAMAVIIGPQHLGPWHSVYGDVAAGSDGLWLHFSGESTSRIRPGRRPWHFSVDNRVILAGTATILPDELWKAEESVLSIVPQMHPIFEPRSRGDRYETYFRARLPGDRPSRHSDQIESLLEHCRPVYADIVNRGQGCRIDFAHKGLL
jgi:hypothetical protein